MLRKDIRDYDDRGRKSAGADFGTHRSQETRETPFWMTSFQYVKFSYK